MKRSARAAMATGAVLGAGAVTAFYAAVIERNAFTLRRFDVPVLAAGSKPIRVLHISDLHITAGQRRKQRWIADLARLEPDLVVNTGDTISDPDAIPQILRALRPLARFPAVFVPGNNDYYTPTRSAPTRYFRPDVAVPNSPPMPWPELSTALVAQGWIDLTHVRTSLDIGGRTVALAGSDDPYLKRARYELIAGPADADAVVRLGVTHAPEPAVLEAFAQDGYDLTLAGHTHGGQVRIPFGPAVVTNCGIDVWRARGVNKWDERMWMHVCAGLGTNPFMPVRFACRPEAVLLTLVSRG